MRRKLAAILVLAFALALVAPAASPVQISYVTSESMEPTIAVDDGYVLVPSGTVETGDIVTFYSEERGSYVTHRVVGDSADGFVTRGDANPSTDQAAGYPAVERSDIAGTVFTVGEDPLVIPFLGTLVSLLGTYWYGVIVGLLLLFGRDIGYSRSRTKENVTRARDIVVPAAIVALVVGVALISLAAVHQTQDYTVTEGATAGPTELEVGNASTETLRVTLTSTVFTDSEMDASGMDIVDTSAVTPGNGTPNGTASGAWPPQRLSSQTTQNVTVTVPPQAETGLHRTGLDMYTYPATLPPGAITALHGLHPLAAALGTVAAIVVPLVAFFVLVTDITTPLRGTRRRVSRRLEGR